MLGKRSRKIKLFLLSWGSIWTMKTDIKLLRRLREPRRVPAMIRTGRDFWLFVIVESLARGALSNN